jgi:hypothetical protein
MNGANVVVTHEHTISPERPNAAATKSLNDHHD